jgi:hypothetical protein
MVREIDVFGVLTGPAPLPGDFNEDGIVDATDYIVWRKSGGTETNYQLWRLNFGRTNASGSGGFGSPAVPEPSGARFFAVALLLLGSRRPTDAGFIIA